MRHGRVRSLTVASGGRARRERTRPGCTRHRLRRRGSGGPHAALVVDTGQQATSYCVALDASSVSGTRLIELASEQYGLAYRLGFGGRAVCMLVGGRRRGRRLLRRATRTSGATSTAPVPRDGRGQRGARPIIRWPTATAKRGHGGPATVERPTACPQRPRSRMRAASPPSRSRVRRPRRRVRRRRRGPAADRSRPVPGRTPAVPTGARPAVAAPPGTAPPGPSTPAGPRTRPAPKRRPPPLPRRPRRRPPAPAAVRAAAASPPRSERTAARRVVGDRRHRRRSASAASRPCVAGDGAGG